MDFCTASCSIVAVRGASSRLNQRTPGEKNEKRPTTRYPPAYSWTPPRFNPTPLALSPSPCPLRKNESQPPAAKHSLCGFHHPAGNKNQHRCFCHHTRTQSKVKARQLRTLAFVSGVRYQSHCANLMQCFHIPQATVAPCDCSWTRCTHNLRHNKRGNELHQDISQTDVQPKPCAPNVEPRTLRPTKKLQTKNKREVPEQKIK